MYIHVALLLPRPLAGARSALELAISKSFAIGTGRTASGWLEPSIGYALRTQLHGCSTSYNGTAVAIVATLATVRACADALCMSSLGCGRRLGYGCNFLLFAPIASGSGARHPAGIW